MQYKHIFFQNIKKQQNKYCVDYGTDPSIVKKDFFTTDSVVAHHVINNSQ